MFFIYCCAFVLWEGDTNLKIMNDSDKRKLDRLNEQQSHIIKNYCDAIGCKNCPLNRKPDDCDSIILQNQIMDLEFKDL